MSIQHMARVWKHSAQKGTGLLVMLAIADYANEEGIAWPSMTTLAEKARVDERTARRLVRKAQRDGELGVEVRARLSGAAGGKQAVNRYTILLAEGGGVLPPPLLQGGGIHDGKVGASDAKGGGVAPPNPSVLHPSVTTSPTRRRERDIGLAALRDAPKPGWEAARRLVTLFITKNRMPSTKTILDREFPRALELLEAGIPEDFLVETIEGVKERIRSIAYLHYHIDMGTLQSRIGDDALAALKEKIWGKTPAG